MGIKLLGQKNEILLQVGSFNFSCHKIVLQDRQKIVGVQSNINDSSPGLHFDFRFILMTMAKRSKSQILTNEPNYYP